MEIKNLEHLKELSSRDDGCDCYIRLNFGARSSKHIKYDSKLDEWYVFNEIDSTDVSCNTNDLGIYTNIPEALEKHALILEK